MGKEQFRARTGCLTCRDRHIKCDETLPKCRNCCKSNRVCERGIRLNFIDIQTCASQSGLMDLPPGTQLKFHDESRAIASGYAVDPKKEKHVHTSHTEPTQQTEPSQASSSKDGPILPVRTASSAEQTALVQVQCNPLPSLQVITNHDEGLLMEIFLGKVAPWMDCLVASKPFANITPFYALSQPALYSTVMACGERYLMPTEESLYHEKACQSLELEIAKPDADHLLCVTISALLHAYGIMGDGGNNNKGHSDRTRALIGQVDLSGGYSHLAGACFWAYNLNSVLDSLVHNSRPMYDADKIDMALNAVQGTDTNNGILYCDEDLWAYRILSTCAKVAALHTEVAQGTYADSMDRLRQDREQYKGWCDEWASNVPRSMMPLCYIPPPDEHSTLETTTHFPQVMFVGSSATVARLLYHVSCLLLVRIGVAERSTEAQEAQCKQIRHAMDICGIASQGEDKYVTLVSR
ncbi:hypothetical protein COCMIDRAFT_22555 [Bipolaris oryzae ATCC 44560]|uniref:Zn(2)-C6 fungal-type domain-containing protein n=1 Tax=Bipolaris oryzae ATCC 44560 TaxID=930090 RepID=W6ZD97_COCMI|nr:uncharacterized protein COCMIDRAFT_22555 [Bipolaris oryzae ATCC 44560]EUC49777.1 hypothetical protein COCMIDRAFT_22555 [Bipolaris oryzae ATCC 44560]